MNFNKIVGLGLIGVFGFACTAQEQAVIKDVSGVVCEVVVQATMPNLAPLCTTLVELEAVVDELINEYQKNHPSMTKEQAKAQYKPSQNEIYFRLQKKHSVKK